LPFLSFAFSSSHHLPQILPCSYASRGV
jgi:hypothetical protein